MSFPDDVGWDSRLDGAELLLVLVRSGYSKEYLLFYNFNMSQTERIFYILDLLMGRGSFTRKEVARHFEVSEKQIWRDKEYLRDRCPLSCGNLDIVYDNAKKAYVLTSESRDALTRWRAATSLGIVRDKESGNAKISSSSSMVLSDASYITYKSYASESFSPSVYDRIMTAMREKRRILLCYPSSKKHPKRVVEPLRLINYGEIWYLVASVDEAILTYSLSRISDVSVLDERVAFSDHERLEKLLDGYGIYSDDNERREYVIRFYSWAIAIVSNQVWQKDQKLRLLEDGRVLEMRIPVSNHTELLSRILFYGDAAEPVSPEDFVDEYRRKCMLMAGRYERV